MPSLPPSYLYTFIAMLAVSSLLVFSFMTYTNAVRFSSETRQLKNLVDRVAGKGTELVTFALFSNATADDFLEMPTTVGNKQYWLRLENDSESAWVEGGFGDSPIGGSDLRVCLPRETVATGYYVAGNGAARLSCNLSDEAPLLCIGSSNEGS